MATLTVGENSYVDLTTANQYCDDMGLDEISDDQLLIRASKFIDRNYANRFIGMRQTTVQTLNWPRVPDGDVLFTDTGTATLDSDGNFIHLNTIPPYVVEATIEMALILQDGTDPYSQPSPAALSETSKIDVIETQKKYSSPFKPAQAGDFDFYKLDLILRPVLRQKGAIKLVR